MVPVSICLIAKNEESHIGECLERLSRLNCEIILADTGSTDRTVEIASGFTPHIHHFNWINDFSAARNFAASKASNDFILSVDCDEYLDTEDLSPFVETFTREFSVNPTLLGRFTIRNMTDSGEFTTEQVTRLYNRRYYRYSGSVHEQLTPLVPTERSARDLSLSFLHMGYATEEIKQLKSHRNLALLQTQLETNGPSCYLFYQMGQCYFSVADYTNARTSFEAALDLLPEPFPEYVQNLMECYGYTLLELQQHEAALGLLEEDLYAFFSHHADFVFLAGLIYMNNGLFQQAIREFTKATTISSHRTEGVNSYKAYYNIGVIHECSGDVQAALSDYKKCGQYPPALARIQHLTT